MTGDAYIAVVGQFSVQTCAANAALGLLEALYLIRIHLKEITGSFLAAHLIEIFLRVGCPHIITAQRTDHCKSAAVQYPCSVRDQMQSLMKAQGTAGAVRKQRVDIIICAEAADALRNTAK